MMQALTWSESFDLREQLSAAKARLKDTGWDAEPEEDLFLDVCKAALDLDVFEEVVEKLSHQLANAPRLLDEVVAGVLRAVEFLGTECGIRSAEMLPSRYQLILLADALRVCPQPSAVIKGHLVRWLWLTTYGNAFRAVTGNKLQRLLLHLRKLVKGETERAWEDRHLPVPIITPMPDRFHFKSARSKSLALRLAGLRPRDASGQPVVDPLELLARHGADAVVPLFRGIAKSANRILVYPHEARVMRELLLMHPDRCSAELLASHGISPQAWQALQEERVVEFLLIREKTLSELDWDFIRPYMNEEARAFGVVLKIWPDEH